MTTTGLHGVILVEDRYYILASSSRVDDRTRVLKHGDTFGVFDRLGDIAPVGIGELGVYHDGTRFLSRLSLSLAGERPMLLSSTVKHDNSVLTVDLTNPDLSLPDGALLPRGTLHLQRELVLWRGVCHERLRVANYGTAPVRTSLEIHFDADFADIFEVRGTPRARRGTTLGVVSQRDGFVLPYRGLDGLARRLRVRWSETPGTLEPRTLAYDLTLPAGGSHEVRLAFGCEIGDAELAPVPFDEAFAATSSEIRAAADAACTIETSNAQFNEWVERSMADLAMMLTPTPHGVYPYAGVPWFSTPFGRDGLITARQMLWAAPDVARGVLAYLAATQADAVDEAGDAAPGKILHERRGGEMAALGEVPFGRYYGSVDATPLFVALAGDYWRRTGDLEFARGLWPHVLRALEWIEGPGDSNQDGFVDYLRRSPNGLVQQGWKDSGDSVFHRDGAAAQGPIALCEVQGYVYAAYGAAARLARALGDAPRDAAFTERAETLRRRFGDAFWSPELGTYAIALDGAERRCDVRTSNPGHCLWSGIASRARAPRIAETLLAPASFSGWGVRTLATSEARYNPMSYHNGSVWPHDNAIVAAGFARYGLTAGVRAVLDGLFEASQSFDFHRLPELFCGFERRAHEGPTLYPVACSPQAWASGAVLQLLEACLGLEIDARRGRLVLRRGFLPEWLDQVRISGIRVGAATVDLVLEHHRHDLGVSVVRREGVVEVVGIR